MRRATFSPHPSLAATGPLSVVLNLELLREATPDGDKLAATFLRLIDVKHAAHYGVIIVAAGKAGDTVRWARQLVERAEQEVER